MASLILCAAGDDILGIRFINLAFFIPCFASALALVRHYLPEEFDWEDR